MKLLSLKLHNFRNYTETCIEFPKRLNFIYGYNGNGKSNILEAIALLALGKSFRSASNSDMLRNNEQIFYVRGDYEKFEQKHLLSYSFKAGNEFQKPMQKIIIDKNEFKTRTKIIGNLLVVIFSPADIDIIENGPNQRRSFIDIVISYQSPSYLVNLVQYNRVLKQRNALLKEIQKNNAQVKHLDEWDYVFAKYAEKISQERLDFIEEFEPILQDTLSSISGDRDSVQIKLHFPFDVKNNIESNTYQRELWKENYFLSKLQENRPRDIRIGYTTTGVHKQSVFLGLQKKETDEFQEIQYFGSQGQKRSLVIALRIAEFYFLRNKLKVNPILLIDDVLRELDEKRRLAFIQLLKESNQAIFTCPDLYGIQDYISDNKNDTILYEIEPEAHINKREIDYIFN